MKRASLFFAALAVVALFNFATVDQAHAGLLDRLAAQPEEIPAPAEAAASPSDVPIPSDVPMAYGPMPAELVPCCDPCLIYKYRHLGSRRWECYDTYSMTLMVIDPTSGSCCEPCCYVDVPVCLPCCCEGEPTVCSHGRVVEYEWCCGYKVKVVFLPRNRVKVIENAH